MDKRPVLLFAVTAIVVAIAGAAVASQPWIFAFIIGTAVLLALLAKIDWWQRLYAITLILMMGATSTIAPLFAVSGYGRYVAAALLLGVTWVTTRRTAPVTTGLLHKRALGALWLTVLIAAASVFWSGDREESLSRVTALTILVALVHLLSTRRWTDRAIMLKDFRVGFYVLTGTFMACMVAPFLGVPGTVAFGGTADTVGRFQGLFNNPNMLALLSAISIPLGWGLFRESPRILRLVSLLPAVVILFMTESRSSIIAAAVAMIWVVLRSGAKTILKTCYLSVLTGALVLASGVNPLGTFLDRFGKLEGGDIFNRATVWEAAVRAFQERPFGYGWQAGPVLFESELTADFPATSAHNSYLQVILELGVLSLIPLVYLIWTMLVVTWRGSVEGMGAGLVGVVGAGLIVQLTESAMLGTGQGYPYIFWFAVAGALAIYKPEPKEQGKTNLLPAHNWRLLRAAAGKLHGSVGKFERGHLRAR